MVRQILALDLAGTPRKWVSAEAAVGYYARSLVVWESGAQAAVFQGGTNRSGARSLIRVRSIVAVRGGSFLSAESVQEPLLTNAKLFARDRRLCAYCGGRFLRRNLSREHILPVSRSGGNCWTNVVTACRACNTRKGCRTPEEAGMPLLYLPYVPSHWEDFVLANRDILADQMDYLLARVPAGSRLKH